MDVNANLGHPTDAISTDEIGQVVAQVTEHLRHQVTTLMEEFTRSEPTPQRTLDLENTLYDFLREFGREAIEHVFS